MTAWFVQRRVFPAACLAAFLVATTAQAQIPKEAVNAALKGPVRVFMLTASSEHDYAHRTQVTPAKIIKTGDTVVAEGRLQNIVRFDDDGFMKYRITCKGKQPPVVEIYDIEESKDVTRALKNALKVGKFVVQVVPAAIGLFSKADEDTDSYDMQLVADGDPMAAKEISQLNEKDWKVPCAALVSAIAARLHAAQ